MYLSHFQWSRSTLRSGQFIIKPNLWFVIAIAIIEGLGDWSANGLDIGFISVDMNGWKGGRDNTITTITLSQ